MTSRAASDGPFSALSTAPSSFARAAMPGSPVSHRQAEIDETESGRADLAGEVGERGDAGVHPPAAQGLGERDHRRDAAPGVDGQQ
jgi:hypothetical protein